MPVVNSSGQATAPSGGPAPARGAPPVGLMPPAVQTHGAVVQVAGYSQKRRRPPLEIIVQGPTNCGKTTLGVTLPGPAAWVVGEPGATQPILDRYGLSLVPQILVTNLDEWEKGVQTGPEELRHHGFASFAAALPSSIEWIVVDTLSGILTQQHAMHTREAIAEWERMKRRAGEGKVKNKTADDIGYDNFAAYEDDLNKANQMHSQLVATRRNILYLCHTGDWDPTKTFQSSTAGKPEIPGKFRKVLQGWASAILYLDPRDEVVRDEHGQMKKIQIPWLQLTERQLPFVKHKWPKIDGERRSPDLSELLKEAGQWPR